MGGGHPGCDDAGVEVSGCTFACVPGDGERSISPTLVPRCGSDSSQGRLLVAPLVRSPRSLTTEICRRGGGSAASIVATGSQAHTHLWRFGGRGKLQSRRNRQ